MPAQHRIYVGTIGEGVFRSLDGGATFARACDGMFVECHVRALAAHPRLDRVLFLGTEQGLFRSDNGADSWARVEGPLNGLQIWSIVVSPANPEVLVVGTCPSRILVSTDAGRTWHEGATSMRQDCPRIIHTRVTSLLADPADARTFWAGVEIDGLHRSQDQGRTWQRVGTGLTSQDIHALVKVSDQVFLAATNNDLNVSRDGGQSWQGLNVGTSMPWSYCRTLAQVPGRPESILLGNGDGPPGTMGAVGLSLDGGKSCALAGMNGSERSNSTIWNFACHPADASMIYASSVSGEVYRSTDQGQSWHKLAREFGEIRALAWTP